MGREEGKGLDWEVGGLSPTFVVVEPPFVRRRSMVNHWVICSCWTVVRRYTCTAIVTAI